MVLERRVQYKRINSYRTRTNRIRTVKTPGKFYHESLLTMCYRWKISC